MGYQSSSLGPSRSIPTKNFLAPHVISKHIVMSRFTTIFIHQLHVGMQIFPETFKRSETFRKFPKKRSETFRNFPIYRPSTQLLKLKNACIYDRSRKECTFALCSYPDLLAHISWSMKYPALPASLGLMRHF